VNTPSTRFHLDKPNGKVMGVCAGIARYSGVDVLWVRVATVLLTLAGFGLVIPAYLLIGILAASNPTY
jgi:phage shock protein C